MDKKIDQMLEERIATEFSKLASLEDGSQEKSSAVTDLSKLYELHLEEVKIEQAKRDEEARKKQAKWQPVVEIGKVAVPAIVSIIGLASYGRWYRVGLDYEREGVIGSTFVRGIVSKIVPRIKM